MQPPPGRSPPSCKVSTGDGGLEAERPGRPEPHLKLCVLMDVLGPLSVQNELGFVCNAHDVVLHGMAQQPGKENAFGTTVFNNQTPEPQLFIALQELIQLKSQFTDLRNREMCHKTVTGTPLLKQRLVNKSVT